MDEWVIWKAKRSFWYQLFFLSIRQWVQGWSVVDGILDSRYCHQAKVQLPEALTLKEKKRYIEHNRSQFMQLDASGFNFHHTLIYNDKNHAVDAVWLMALKKSFDTEMGLIQQQQKKNIRLMVCDWQYQLNHFKKKFKQKKLTHTCLVACFDCQQESYCIAMIKNKIIYLEKVQYAIDQEWLSQQLEKIQERLREGCGLECACSSEIMRKMPEEIKDQWQVYV